MKRRDSLLLAILWVVGPGIGLTSLAPRAAAQDTKPWFNIYGFTQLDMGYDFKRNDPAWFDVVRPTKLPSDSVEFGANGRWFASVRQTRFGVKSSIPTPLGELKTHFEFDMFGVGVDAGQTTIRPRHFYGEIGHFGAGQTHSPFMDIDVFPNSLDYWGPCGMAFFRNVQVRWMPLMGDTRLTFALERPGASADAGIYSGRIELQGITPRFPLPDFSAEYKVAQPWGYLRVGGIVRYMVWDDLNGDQYDLSGHAVGWGLDVSSNIKVDRDVIRLFVLYGEGVENYFNDAPVDIGAQKNPNNPKTPVTGKALGDLGIVAFLDHVWNDKFSSSIGYSQTKITNSDAQAPNAFRLGHYALANLLYTPVPNFMTGFEFQYAHRDNNSDGFKADDYRIQFSAKFNFSQMIGG